jgi:hypothetical protein
VDDGVAEADTLSGNKAAVAMGGVDEAGAAHPVPKYKSKVSARILERARSSIAQ